jgi:phospholipid/cholesterol/gamma-HCH transport system substrate-binding protein
VQAMKILRDPRLWGVSALALATVVGLLAAMVYATPPGNKTISFYTADASSISPGLTVRIGGFTIGKVKDMSIEPEQVRVRATVDGDAFIGDQSSVEVRMLTVVGGYYVDIDSLGDSPLGDKVIPAERVTLPYSLVRALTDTTKLTKNVETTPINESLNQVQQGLTGSNLETISSVMDAGTKLTDALERQRGQITAILNLSDEWLQKLANYRGQLQGMLDKISILEQTLVLYGKNFGLAMMGLGDIVEHIQGLGPFYLNHREEFLAKFIHWQQTARTWADRSGLIVRILRRTRDRMMTTLDRQNAPRELLATDLCIPLPESPC